MMTSMSIRSFSVAALSFVCACTGPMVTVGPADVPGGAGGQVSVTFEEAPPAPKGGDRAPSTGTFPVPDCPIEADAGVALATVCRGAPAPFSGTLISPAAAAKLIAELESCPAKCDEAARHARQQCEDTCAYDLKVLQAQLKAEQDKRAAQVLSRDKQVEALSKQLAAERDTPVWLWVSGGALGGALLTVGAVLLVR